MYSYKRRVNFYDCDPAGILFFGRVYELCHSAYESMIESFNLQEPYWTNENYITPIIHSEASYHKPVRPGEMITINVQVSQLRKSSFELEYELVNLKGEICTKVKIVHIFIHKKNWEKINMPDNLLQAFLSHKKI